MTERVVEEYAGGASSAIMGSRLWWWCNEWDWDWDELKLAEVGGDDRLDMGLVSRVLGSDLSLQCNGIGKVSSLSIQHTSIDL